MALHLLFTIQNPDFSKPPYSSAETYEIYWDDVALSIEVVNPDNGFTVINSQNKTIWRIGEYSPYKFCAGSTLNSFRIIADFPWAERLTDFNSPTCIANTVCDAYIYEPLLTRTSENGANDGAVTIRAYSSAFGLEYGITNGPDGSIPTPVWQVSPTFENLAPGNYTAHVRDSQGCEDEKSFTIEEQPLYGIRFTATYRDKLNVLTSINILKREYAGTAEEVMAGDDPLVIKEGGSGMFDVIKGQECVISMQAAVSEQFIELFSGDDREFRIDVYKGEIPTLFWRGWLVPDMYLEPYIAPPYNMSFSATDGLGELKNRPFSDAIPEGIITQWEVITHILGKIETRLVIQEAVNIYETRMNQLDSSSPLLQAVVSLDGYYNGKEASDCATVLEAILKPYGAFIRQASGTWQIFRVEELKSNFPRRNYEWHGEYTGNFPFSPERIITRAGVPNAFHWIERSQALELRPAYKQAEVHFDYALRDNLVRGGNIQEQDFDSGWNHKYIDGLAIYTTEIIDAKAKQYALQMSSVTSPPSAAYLQTERIWVANDPLLSLYFKIEFKIIGPSYGGTGEPPAFMWSVKLNEQYLQPPAVPNGPLTWDTAFHQFLFSSTGINQWQTVELQAPIPEEGWLTVMVFEAFSGDYDFINVQVKNITTLLFRNTPPAIATEETFTATNTRKQFFIPETVEALHGDVIPFGNAPAMYRNLILVNGANPSLDWQRRGKMEATPLLQLLANAQLSLRANPVKVLRGTLRGSYNMNQVLQEPDGTRYMPVTQEYNDRQRTVSGEFIELLGTGATVGASYFLMETGDHLLTETGHYIELES